jgi:hypothetical protein
MVDSSPGELLTLVCLGGWELLAASYLGLWFFQCFFFMLTTPLASSAVCIAVHAFDVELYAPACPPALQDATQLLQQQRSLQHALAESERETALLRAQLQAAQAETAATATTSYW